MNFDNPIHRWNDGTVAIKATARYCIAWLFPYWDGATGRAFTKFERQGGVVHPIRRVPARIYQAVTGT